MKFCPYCGASCADSTASFCSNCGKKLSQNQAAEPDAMEESRKTVHRNLPKKEKKKKSSRKKPLFPKKKRVEKAPASDAVEVQVDDGYDGYYDDVLPPDLEQNREGLDKELIQKIVLLGLGVLLVVSLCVAMMYLL